MSYLLYLGDAIAFLQGLEKESVDLVITDPPYESLEKHRAVGTTTRLTHSKSSSNDWFEIFRNNRFPELFQECNRVLKKNGHLYVFSDQETMFAVKPMGEATGLKFWKPLVWNKGKIGTGYHYRAQYEFILFFEKGKRRLSNLGVPDVLTVPPVARKDVTYPTEKPVELLKILVEQSSSPGELVADPFAGSGSTGEAAIRLGRRFVGNDLSPKSVILMGQRLGKVVLEETKKAE